MIILKLFHKGQLFLNYAGMIGSSLSEGLIIREELMTCICEAVPL